MIFGMGGIFLVLFLLYVVSIVLIKRFFQPKNKIKKVYLCMN